MTACSAALALVLALDVSGSVSDADWRMQRDATASALVSPEVVRAVERQDTVAIMVVTWGSGVHEATRWHVASSLRELVSLADELRLTSRPESGQTDLAGLLQSVPGLLAGLRCHYLRAVLDISGDGPANVGAPEPARQALIEAGVTINGLPIVTPSEPDLEAYYRENVITPGGFVEPAESPEVFGAALRRKLVREIAAR